VLNLDETIAVTQNYVSEANVVDVLNFLKTRRDQVSGFCDDKKARSLYETFSKRLRKARPEIWAEYERVHAKRIGFWRDLAPSTVTAPDASDGSAKERACVGSGGDFSFNFTGFDE